MTESNTQQSIRALLGDLIESGELSEGDSLPSIRTLARDFGASPVTVQRVISELARAGVVEPVPGRGTYVRRRSAAARVDTAWQAPKLPVPPPLGAAFDDFVRPVVTARFPLASGYLDERLLPMRELRAAASRGARRPGAWTVADPAGVRELRDWFVREAAPWDREHTAIVTPGSQAALASLFRALASPGDSVLVEAPTYLGALVALQAARLRPVPVPSDGDGMLVEYVPEALSRSGAAMIYVQPAFANPHGACLPAARRQRLLEAADEAGAFIVEDDYARDLAIDGPPPPPLIRDDAQGRVIYLRSLSKSAAPSLRVAIMLASGPAGARLQTVRAIEQLFVSRVLQETALEFLVSAAWPRHLRRLRAGLRERRDAAVGALAQHWPEAELDSVPKGGFHLWVRLPDGVDDVALATAARGLGVAVNAGCHWFPSEAPGPFLRLSYAAASSDELAEGIGLLAQAAATPVRR
jgi:DNA-binding transcriptional MocR family regulator